MGLFKLTIDTNSINDFNTNLNRLNSVLVNTRVDHDFLINNTLQFFQSLKKYGDELRKISDFDFQFEKLPILNSFIDTLKTKINAFIIILEESFKEFVTQIHPLLKDSISAESSEHLEKIIQSIAEYNNYVNSQKTVIESLKKPLEENSVSEEKLLVELRKYCELRYYPLEELIELRQKLKLSNDKSDKIREELSEKMVSIKNDFNDKNADKLELFEKILEEILAAKKRILGDHMKSTKKKIELFLNGFNSTFKKIMRGYNPESDSAAYSVGINDGSKENYMHENLMSVDDLTKVYEDGIFYSKTAVNQFKTFLEKIREIHYNFEPKAHLEESMSSKISTISEKLYNLYGALNDSISANSFLFKREIKNLNLFVTLIEKWDEMAKKFLASNTDKLVFTGTKAKNKTDGLKIMEAFDSNFFDALEVSESCPNEEIKFKNSDTEIRKVFSELEQRLKDDASRKMFLRVFERYFTSTMHLLQNSLVKFVENFCCILNECRSILLAVFVSIENTSILSSVPTIKENSESYRYMKREIVNRKKIVEEEEKTEISTTTPDENFANKINADDIFERFIGEEENNKFKNDQTESNMNFFSFLVDEIKDPEKEKKTEKSKNELSDSYHFNCTLNEKETKPSHFMDIQSNIDEVVVFKKNSEFELKLNLKEYTLLRISGIKTIMNEVDTVKRTVTFQKKSGDAYTVYVIGKKSELELLYDIFKTRSKLKRSASDINSFKVFITSGVAKKKGEKRGEGTVKISLSYVKMFKVNNGWCNIDNFLYGRDYFDKRILISKNDSTRDKFNFLEFVNYEERDVFLSIMKKMLENLHAEIKEKKESRNVSIWFGVFNREKKAIIKSRSEEDWIPKNQSVYVFVVYGSQKMCTQNEKSIKQTLNNSSNSFYIKAHLVKSEKIHILVFCKKELDCTSFVSLKGKKHIGLVFSIKDSTYAFFASSCSSFENFKNTKHFAEVTSTIDEKNLITCFDKMLIFDNIFWIQNFGQSMNTADISAIKGSNDMNSLWEGDAVNCEFNEKKIFADFKQIPFEENYPIGGLQYDGKVQLKPNSTDYYPMRAFYKSQRKNCSTLELKSQSTLKDSLDEIRPFSATFNATPRENTIQYTIVDNLSEINKSCLISLKNASFEPLKKEELFPQNDQLHFSLLHNNISYEFISLPGEFDSESKIYVWPQIGKGLFKNENDQNKDKNCHLMLYVEDEKFLKETALRVRLGTRSRGVVGIAAIKLVSRVFSENGKGVEVEVFDRDSVMIGTFKINITAKFENYA